MKRIGALAISVMMIACLISGCGAASGEATVTSVSMGTALPEVKEGNGPVIKFATGGQDTLPSYAAAIDVVSDIEAQRDDLNIQYYGSRQLGDDEAILQQVMTGTIQMGGTGASALAVYTNLMDAFTIPFLINNYDIERQAVKLPEAQAIFDKIEDELGIKILASYDSGMRYLANNTRPIESVQDMKGLKMRVVPTDCLINSFSALGANPSTMNYGEIYTGLQNKVIDGEEINITSIYSEKHYEVLKYFTEIGLYPFETIIFCNAKWFNSLDPEVQEVLENGFDKGYDYVFDKYIANAEANGYQAMEDAGVQITKIEDTTPFEEAVAPVTEKYINADPLIKAFVDKVETLKESDE